MTENVGAALSLPGFVRTGPLEEHILDLTKRAWSTTRYGLIAIGTWVRIDERWRPCMAIVLAKGPMRPCVIPLEDAWRWSDLIGSPFAAAARVLGELGVAITEDNALKLVSLVNSRMADLVAMPPRPPDAAEHAEPVAEVTTVDPIHGKIEVEI